MAWRPQQERKNAPSPAAVAGGGGVFSTGESDLNLLFCLPEAIPLFKVGIATSSILHHSQPPLTGGADPGSWCQAQC